VPGVEELKVHVELEVAPGDRTRLLGLHATARPVEGDADAERSTVPAKLLMLKTWTDEEAVVPELKLTEEVLVEIEKSGVRGLLTVTVLAAWPVIPAESVTVRVTEYAP
jgi:hypothetical protein